MAAVSKVPNERNQAAEEEMRKRIAEISAERQKLSDVLAERFPDYVALANPKPLTLKETQDLLSDDEAVVAFNIGEKKSYAWVVTRTACGLGGDTDHRQEAGRGGQKAQAVAHI